MKPWELFWAKAIEMYCKTELTKESDKLVAISGIARSLTAMPNLVYVAGLWQKYEANSVSSEGSGEVGRIYTGLLESQLLWETLHKDSDVFKYSAYKVYIPLSRRPRRERVPS
jgi:hypothetical protein